MTSFINLSKETAFEIGQSLAMREASENEGPYELAMVPLGKRWGIVVLTSDGSQFDVWCHLSHHVKLKKALKKEFDARRLSIPGAPYDLDLDPDDFAFNSAAVAVRFIDGYQSLTKEKREDILNRFRDLRDEAIPKLLKQAVYDVMSETVG